MSEIGVSSSERPGRPDQLKTQPDPMQYDILHTRSNLPKSHPVQGLKKTWICCNCQGSNSVQTDAVCGRCHHQQSQCCSFSHRPRAIISQPAPPKTRGSPWDGNAGDWQHMSGTCPPQPLFSRAKEVDCYDKSPSTQDDSQDIGSPRPFPSATKHKPPKVTVSKRRLKFNLESSIQASAGDWSRADRPDTGTGDNGESEVRLRVDANAPLSIQFNGDMEGRTRRMLPAENGMADLVISGGSKGKEGLRSTHYDSQDRMRSNQPSKNPPVTGIGRRTPHYSTKLYEEYASKGREESTFDYSDRISSRRSYLRDPILPEAANPRSTHLNNLLVDILKEARDANARSSILGQVSAKSRGLDNTKDSFNRKEQEVKLTQARHIHDTRKVQALRNMTCPAVSRQDYLRDWFREDIHQSQTTASRPTGYHSKLDDIASIPIHIPPRITTPTSALYQKRNAAVEHASNTEDGSKDNDTRKLRRQSSAGKAALLDKTQAGKKSKALQTAKMSKGKRDPLFLDHVEHPSEFESDVISALDSAIRSSSTTGMTKDATSTKQSRSLPQSDDISFDKGSPQPSPEPMQMQMQPIIIQEYAPQPIIIRELVPEPVYEHAHEEERQIIRPPPVFTEDHRGLEARPTLEDASSPNASSRDLQTLDFLTPGTARDVHELKLYNRNFKLRQILLANTFDHPEFFEMLSTQDIDHGLNVERKAKQSPITAPIRGQTLDTTYSGGSKESIHASPMSTKLLEDDDNEIDRYYPDNISQPSSYATSIASVFSTISLASSTSVISGSSGYSTVQIETATKVLLSIFHKDATLLPMYKSAIDNPNIGPERLQRNLRRIFKAFAGQLEIEATERLEYLAARLVLVKSRQVANSLVEKLRGGRPNPWKSGNERHDESSDEDDDESPETRLVNEEAFEDLALFREFLVESEAFKTLRAQVQAFVTPKSTHIADVGAPKNMKAPKEKCVQQCSSQSALQSKTHLTWQDWLEDVKHAVDGMFCQGNMTMTAKIMLYLGTDALMLATDGILIATGHLEPALRPGMTRLRWQCDCGDSLHGDVVELREGGIAELMDHMHRTSGAKVRAFSYNQQTGNQKYIAPRPVQWVRNAVTKIGSALTRPTQPSCLPQHNTQSPVNACSVSSSPAPQQKILHLLTCMHRNQLRKVLHQDRIEDVTTDRTLLCFLRIQYLRHRGRFLHMLSLKSVKGIFFVKFRLPIGGSVDVRHHNPCCVAASVGSVTCECIPPLPKVEPSPGAEYRCIPGPPATYPPIPPEYLSSLFTCPTDVHEEDTWILDQLPKRTCGQLQGQIGKPAEGWGIYYQEGWDRDIITLAILMIFVVASLLFGILWSRFQYDIQGAFGVSAYIVASCAVIIPVIATRAEKLG